VAAGAHVCARKGQRHDLDLAIARNLRIDRLRREVPWQELPKERLEQASADALPDEVLAEGERQARMRAALATLPAEQHDVVALSYVEGLSHSQIAARLGLPLGTVKARMRIAYHKLRAAVGDLK
jgi:RNA polymerase sigma-70 factor, ECF subfamily